MHLNEIVNPFGGSIFFQEITNSTMDDAKKSPEHGAIFFTHQQLNGKCRSKERQWFNHPEDIILTLSLDKNIHSLSGPLPLIVALSLVHFINQLTTTASIKIKWPNDLLINDHKIAGILCQEENDFYFIGIGFNISSKASLNQVSHTAYPAIGLAEILPNQTFIKESLINQILLALKINFINNNWLSEFNQWLYKPSSMVTYQVAEQFYTGTINRVESDGALILISNKNEEITIYSGEAVRR